MAVNGIRAADRRWRTGRGSIGEAASFGRGRTIDHGPHHDGPAAEKESGRDGPSEAVSDCFEVAVAERQKGGEGEGGVALGLIEGAHDQGVC